MYKPKFSISSKINRWIVEIEKAKERIRVSRILPEEEINLRFRTSVEAVFSSTTIEGNVLDKSQVVKVLSGEMRSEDRMVVEVQNYKKALDWIKKRVKTGGDLKMEDILKIHFLVTNGLLVNSKVGKIRSGPIYVINAIDEKEEVVYEGPNSKKVKKLLNDLLIWIKKRGFDIHPILVAGVLHYEFVSIHPFADGNGRVARLLVKLFLDSVGYGFRGILTLDKYYLENRLGYYNFLNQAKSYEKQREADLTDWLEFFIEGFWKVVEDLKREIESVGVGKKGKIIRLSSDEIQILDFVKQFGQVTGGEIREIISGSERTVQRRVRNLISKGFLVRKGKGKSIFYEIKE